MTREELNKAMVRYLADGGKITKLPDGPDFRFQPYGVKVANCNAVDLTATEDPGTKKQREVFETNTLQKIIE